jgi:tetratricopeptide (TPR) repeat protein
MTKPLIFLSYGVTTAPLIPQLASEYCLVVPEAAIVHDLTARGVDAITWNAFADAEAMARIPAEAEAIARTWAARLCAQASTLYRFGRSDHSSRIAAAVGTRIQSVLPSQLAARHFGASLAASGRLAAVVVHEDVVGLTRAFLQGVDDAGVPTVHVPHGVYFEERIVGADLHGVAHARVIAAAGVAQREWFLRRGVLPQRVVLTGNPSWDGLCGLPRASAASLGLEPGRVMTVATSWVGRDSAYRDIIGRYNDTTARACLAAAAILQRTAGDLRLVLKLHPSAPADEEARARRMASEAGARVDLAVRDRSPALLAATDVLLTLPSTLGVEAVLAGTPVVSPGFPYDDDPRRDPVWVAPVEARAMAATVRAVLDGTALDGSQASRRREYLARHNGACDGRAAERVATLVREVAHRVRSARPREDAGAAAHLRAARASLVRARALLQDGRGADALEELDPPRLDALSPAAGNTAAELWVLRGEILMEMKRRWEAEDCFRRALECGEDARAHTGLGLALLERGEHREAEAHLTVASRLAPDSEWAWCGLGILAAFGGDRDRAASCLGRALSINPSNPDAQAALEVL